MVQPRQFGSEIDPNRTENGELSEKLRAAIVYAAKKGVPKAQIARDIGCSRSTVYRTINHFQTYHTLQSLSRGGRPKKLTLSAIRYIYRIIRKFPTIS
ncbi:uncharacterized protein N7483_005013 [Penicillium malachiteum]|uniref:uncharacterized protein n=1 Tax=Penicillium malachiteum TaxID=1324776 RepID=UPI002547724E|nr:uncharacterized protein N7483_005013 [Penicillium malachiteum]KAJ5730505.1 hypothetical protein N7483_005013 [Penicillium malachiteum]